MMILAFFSFFFCNSSLGRSPMLSNIATKRLLCGLLGFKPCRAEMPQGIEKVVAQCLKINVELASYK